MMICLLVRLAAGNNQLRSLGNNELQRMIVFSPRENLARNKMEIRSTRPNYPLSSGFSQIPTPVFCGP